MNNIKDINDIFKEPAFIVQVKNKLNSHLENELHKQIAFLVSPQFIFILDKLKENKYFVLNSEEVDYNYELIQNSFGLEQVSVEDINLFISAMANPNISPYVKVEETANERVIERYGLIVRELVGQGTVIQIYSKHVKVT